MRQWHGVARRHWRRASQAAGLLAEQPRFPTRTLTRVTEVLLIEDDERIRAALAMVLEDEGHRVHEAGSGEAALESLRARQVDVAIIDVMLPGMDGFELCRRVRVHSEMPILMLTARTDSHDVVAGLEAGADDYVTKPFVPKELAARIRANLRRARGVDHAGEHLCFDDLEILPRAGVVRRGGVEVALTRTEFSVLCELANHPNQVFSREQLLELVWGYSYFGDGRLVDVHVHRLRAKVEPDPGQPRHVVTVRGLGYKLQP